MITARLLRLKIGLPEEAIVALPVGSTIEIEGVKVTFLDANHCPGAVMVLFVPPNGEVLNWSTVNSPVLLISVFLRSKCSPSFLSDSLFWGENSFFFLWFFIFFIFQINSWRLYFTLEISDGVHKWKRTWLRSWEI